MARRPFLSVHRLAVFAPVWMTGLMVGLAYLLGFALEAFAPSWQLRPGPEIPALMAGIGFAAGFLASRCPRCGALAITHNGHVFGWAAAFFAHEQCPGCGLDLEAVTPWGSGVIRQRRDWIDGLSPLRKAWVNLGLGRILLVRVVVVAGAVWALASLGPFVTDATAATSPFTFQG